MAVLIVLFGVLLLYRTLGALGLSLFATWISCARYGLATMFAFTAVSHFAPMKKDLIAMVPPALPHPDVIVLVTGIMELAAAAGLLFEATRFWDQGSTPAPQHEFFTFLMGSSGRGN